MDDFYAARDTTTAPLPWPSIAPPFTLSDCGALVETSSDAAGMMTGEFGPDLRLRIPGDVAVERAAALVRALRGAA